MHGGELLTQDATRPEAVSADALQPGMYYLRAYDKNDRVIGFTRFIKQ